ncbi:MAG: hypothetical protein ILO68_06790, partial [Clostridia bacterium]|nr:hypothetical protein [Clostridia bacterium]
MFPSDEPLTEDDIASVYARRDRLASEMSIDTAHYSPEGELTVKAGDILETNAAVLFTYSPNEYTTVIYDEDENLVSTQSFRFDVPEIILPASESGKIQFRYTVCGKKVMVGTEPKKVTFTVKEIDSGNYAVITREEVSVQRENVLSLVSELNMGIALMGLLAEDQQAMAFIPVEDENDNLSIIFRISPDHVDKVVLVLPILASALIVNDYTHVRFGDGMLWDGSAMSVQAVLDAFLNSGIGVDRILGLCTEDGDIIEMDPVGTVIGAQTEPRTGMQYIPVLFGSRILYADLPGGYLADVHMTFGYSENDIGVPVTMYFTLEDLDRSPERLANMHKGAEKIKEKGNFSLHDGMVDLELTLDESFHQMCLLALGMTGNADLSDLEATNLIPAMHLVKTFLDAIVSDETVTTTTIENTLARMNTEEDLSSFRESFELYRDMLNRLIDNSHAEDEQYRDGVYTANVNYDLTVFLEMLGLHGQMRRMIKESNTGVHYALRIKINNTFDYEALLLARTEEKGARRPKFVKNLAEAIDATEEIQTEESEEPIEIPVIPDGTMITLLDDVHGDLAFTADGLVLDLNGCTVEGNLSSIGSLLVTDSRA